MPERTERRYRNSIVKRMTALGTYRAEFLPTVERLAALYVERDELERQYAASGGCAVIAHTNKAGASNPAKNPYLTARDEVYSQLLSHERELGLTPAALKKMNEAALRQKKPGGLSAVLETLHGADAP